MYVCMYMKKIVKAHEETLGNTYDEQLPIDNPTTTAQRVTIQTEQ